MNGRLPLTDREGEVRELDEHDFSESIEFDQLPAAVKHKVGALRRRGPQREPTKERITIRLSREVVQAFRETGPGWQSRIDAVLKNWLAENNRQS